MIASAGKRSIIDRMVGAALLELETYEEASVAPSVRVHAAVVVIVSAIAAGLGSLGAGFTGLVLGAFVALVGWGMYAAVIYWTATTRFRVPNSPDVRSATLRVLGLASSPRVFLIFAFVPGIGFLVGLAVHAWALITTVFAVKAALDLDTRPAIATAVSGWLPMLALWALVYAVLT